MSMFRTCTSCGAVNRIPAARLAEIGRCGRCKHRFEPIAAPIDVGDVIMFDEIISNSKLPILVDFWAAWCGPCRMVAPEVAKAAATMAGRALVLKVNTEQVPALAARYHVQGIPNFVVVHDRAVVRQQAGALRHPELVRLVEDVRAA